MSKKGRKIPRIEQSWEEVVYEEGREARLEGKPRESCPAYNHGAGDLARGLGQDRSGISESEGGGGMIIDRQIIARLIAEAYRSADDAERVRRLALEALWKLGYNADCAIAGLLWADYRIAASVPEPPRVTIAPVDSRPLFHPLRQARIDKHLSQREVAAVAGLTALRLNDIERRRAEPTEAELAALRLTLAKQPEDIVVAAARLSKRRAAAE